MKREFLKNFKVGEQELPKEIIDAIMDENGKDIEGAKKPFADYDAIKSQLAEAGKTIEGFKALDVDGIKKAAGDWKEKAEKAEQDAAAKIAEMEFNGRLSTAINGAKGKDVEKIKKLLDLDTLKASKNQSDDMETALETLKAEVASLFEDTQTPPPYASGTGTSNVFNQVSKASFAKMGYRERLELKATSPELYEKMKE